MCQDLVNVHLNYLNERETVLHNFVGSLLRKKREKKCEIPVAQSTRTLDLPSYVVPKHTPTAKCFLRHDVKTRLKVFFQQRRYFGCFLLVVVSGHARLRDCKHPRYCTVCKNVGASPVAVRSTSNLPVAATPIRRHVNVGATAKRRFPTFVVLIIRCRCILLYL